MTLDYSNLNLFASSLLIEELVRLGVGQFVISPGSRSAPLTIVAARNREAVKHLHFDERGAAFFALGLARATNEPTALICTSGTAVANYLPAVIEASAEMLPLIILSADRPPELRNCGSNQTIVQPGLFGEYVRYTSDIICPDERSNQIEILKEAGLAVVAAMTAPVGPVHLNCMFREPLVPGNETETVATDEAIEAWYLEGVSSREMQPAVSDIDIDALEKLAKKLEASRRGIIIAATLRSNEERQAVSYLSKKLGWPILADIKAGLRGEIGQSLVIPNYDLILKAGGRSLDAVDTIVQIGGRIVSGALLEFIQTSSLSCYVQIDSDPRDIDPTHLVTDRLIGEQATICNELADLVVRGSKEELYSDLLAERDKIESAIGSTCHDGGPLHEVEAARIITRLLPDGSSLMLGNSMPIRLFDSFMFSTAAKNIVTNRGASGIDGLVATAAGFAAGEADPLTLVIGDLSLLHDLNSLAFLKRLSTPMIIVVLNNDGGGIFDHLPSSQLEDVHQKYFTTPHGLRFKNAAAMFSLKYAAIDSAGRLEDIYSKALADSKHWLLELRIDREASFEHQQTVVGNLSEQFKNEQ